MTTVEAVEVSFNSLKDTTNLRREWGGATFFSLAVCDDSCLLHGSGVFVRHILDDEGESSCFFNKAFSIGGDGFRLLPEVT